MQKYDKLTMLREGKLEFTCGLSVRMSAATCQAAVISNDVKKGFLVVKRAAFIEYPLKEAIFAK